VELEPIVCEGSAPSFFIIIIIIINRFVTHQMPVSQILRRVSKFFVDYFQITAVPSMDVNESYKTRGLNFFLDQYSNAPYHPLINT